MFLTHKYSIVNLARVECTVYLMKMQPQDLVQSIIQNDVVPDVELILGRILPPRNEIYSLNEIDEKLGELDSEIRGIQYVQNNIFDDILDESTINRIHDLYTGLHVTQLDLMKLQCDIAYTKEQSNAMRTVCDSPLIRERRDVVLRERDLKESLRQLKFEPLKKFFHDLAQQLDSKILDGKKLCSFQVSNYQQLFDWTLHHQAMNLLKVSGKALVDIHSLEQLYQSEFQFSKVIFRKPPDLIEMNNFIESKSSDALESLLEIVVNQEETISYGALIRDDQYKKAFGSPQDLAYVVFKDVISIFERITSDCYRLFLDLHISYIEAHLTDGINIDALNGSDQGRVPPPEEQSMPLYAYSPQDYITQIGQHLLTLRKQTDQYNNCDKGVLVFTLKKLASSQHVSVDIAQEKTVTDIIMRCIARQCIMSMLGRTNPSILTKLNANGKRQLATDALYLDNVLEDLRLLDSQEPNVEKFKKLLSH